MALMYYMFLPQNFQRGVQVYQHCISRAIWQLNNWFVVEKVMNLGSHESGNF